MRIEWIVLAIVVAAACYAVFAFNRLIRRRNMMREAWSGIDVQLRRRSDLIPNLVQVVKAYAAHERGLFEDIAARRASSLAVTETMQKAVAEQALQGSLGRLFAVAEGYPQLKADQNFRALQDQLAEIEDQLQMARRYFNGTVRDFNIGVQSFPDVLLARLLGWHEEHFFEIDQASAAAPAVNLSGS
ncbi:LemA family protein [Bradyrhizobium prioriisuperbiae]|uniref:LemA family protein n=1 Tax=Bradyrhizobium prioriisuperbiae TaxID=2854389 RepID=UPI0028E49537|nr:LemA family protein [Bradyrhizobium prioritasuperba]